MLDSPFSTGRAHPRRFPPPVLLLLHASVAQILLLRRSSSSLPLPVASHPPPPLVKLVPASPPPPPHIDGQAPPPRPSELVPAAPLSSPRHTSHRRSSIVDTGRRKNSRVSTLVEVIPVDVCPHASVVVGTIVPRQHELYACKARYDAHKR
jgi:hypothetical protein